MSVSSFRNIAGAFHLHLKTVSATVTTKALLRSKDQSERGSWSRPASKAIGGRGRPNLPGSTEPTELLSESSRRMILVASLQKVTVRSNTIFGLRRMGREKLGKIVDVFKTGDASQDCSQRSRRGQVLKQATVLPLLLHNNNISHTRKSRILSPLFATLSGAYPSSFSFCYSYTCELRCDDERHSSRSLDPHRHFRTLADLPFIAPRSSDRNAPNQRVCSIGSQKPLSMIYDYINFLINSLPLQRASSSYTTANVDTASHHGLEYASSSSFVPLSDRYSPTIARGSFFGADNSKNLSYIKFLINFLLLGIGCTSTSAADFRFTRIKPAWTARSCCI
ncbi:hypothetical protein EJ04DRAFT_528700 [Polyplosphaeria fusca]|uniref:Uncharacterized protein n=1 Tax=Polyplosphaeria fusca TaxID=682080 RepID=A0A9P4QNW3_9PLEO|nr:hypothetical protein EJ04DRAFT_528700 [Polyplosphaeria fusca]